MGAVRMRADKSIIHTSQVCNKQAHQMFLTLNCCFQLKYESSIHLIAFSSEYLVLLESGERHAQIKHRLHAKTVQNVDFDVYIQCVLKVL